MFLKRFIVFLFLSLFTVYVYSQWTDDEIYNANTGATASVLTKEEKKVVVYVNLARLYPKKFLQMVVKNYERPSGFTTIDKGSRYYTSLVSTLSYMHSTYALNFDISMYYYAKCWAEEMGRKGIIGHNRISCIDGYFSECCQYGYSLGRDIVFALLLDEGVPSLGHRTNLLENRPRCIGVKISSHSQYEYGAVIDCGYEVPLNKVDYRSRDVSRQFRKEINEELGLIDTGDGYVNYNNSEVSSQSVTKSNLTVEPQPNKCNSSTNSASGTSNENAVKNSNDTPNSLCKGNKTTKKARHKFYDYSGKRFLSIVNASYSYDFGDARHMMLLGVLGFRYKMFGFSLLDFEMGVFPFSKSFGWSPKLELYIPVSKSFSINMHAGTSVDITYLGQYLLNDYTYSDANFYVSGVWGISLYHAGLRNLPFKFFCEYRYPFMGTFQSKGFYVGFQMSPGLVFN